MTTVGYGDIVAQNYTEVQFVLLLLLIASIVFAGLMGALTDLICNLNAEGNARSERKVMLSRYMRWRAVPKDLFMSVREHLLFLWDTDEGYGEFEGLIKEQLPPTLKRELCHHIFGRILRSAPFLAWMRGCEVCMKELSQGVECLFLSKGDHLFRVGQPNEHIYVLLKGTLHISQNEKLSLTPGVPQAEDPMLAGTSGFSIPRNKEANIVDVFKMMFHGLQQKRQILQNLRHKTAETKKEVMLGKLSVTFGKRGEDSDSEAEIKESESKGKTGDLLESHVDSSLLNSAFIRLHKRDIRERRSAAYIQRRWRRKHPPDAEQFRCHQKRLSAAKTKYVHAPAYLGESCLWTPYEDWDSAPAARYPYSACCETRCEFAYLPRSAVKDIIERFSPWLGDRFEFFRQAVVKNMMHEEDARKCSSKDTEHLSSSAPAAGPSSDLPQRPTGEPHAGAASPSNPSRNASGMPSEPLQLAPTPDSSLTVPLLPGMTEELPPGRPNYEAFAAMNYGLGIPGPVGQGSPGTPFNPHAKPPRAGALSGRSFRQAAAAAVARVAAQVTPPSALPTPGATPRATTPVGTPRNEWGYPSAGVPTAAAPGRGMERLQDDRQPESLNSMAQPLLQSRSPGGSV